MIPRAALALCLLALAHCGSESSPAPDARAVDVQCNLETQDCPGAQKCNPSGPPPPDQWTGTRCVPDNATNGSPAGTPCFTAPDASDTCDPVSVCLQLGTGEGFCTAYCSDSPSDSCDPAERCVLYDEAIGAKLCAQQCDLAAPDCPRFYECVDTRAGPACVPYVLRDRIPR